MNVPFSDEELDQIIATHQPFPDDEYGCNGCPERYSYGEALGRPVRPCERNRLATELRDTRARLAQGKLNGILGFMDDHELCDELLREAQVRVGKVREWARYYFNDKPNPVYRLLDDGFATGFDPIKGAQHG